MTAERPSARPVDVRCGRAAKILPALALVSGVASGIALPASPVQGPEASLLVSGGLLVDGTGTPARRADVRVVGDAIVEVAERIEPRAGDRIVEASGLVVAPGFLDMHSHASRGLESHPEAESQIRQGITTVIVGQDGSSDLPVSAFLDRIDRLRPAIDVATAVGAGTVRGLVLGSDFRRAATPGEITVMEALVDRAMRDGAVGLSSGLEYDPGFYATADELVALARVAARHGGYYASHVRDEEHEAFASWREAIEVGVALACRCRSRTSSSESGRCGGARPKGCGSSRPPRATACG